jgi:predicted DNA-binding transcriptional regulator AlpA
MSLALGTHGSRPSLLPVPTVLRKVPISRAYFYKLIKAGKGPVLHKIGDRTFVSEENLADWLSKHEVARAA